MKKVAVVLSGCGVFDGSEIHEGCAALLAIHRAGIGRIVFHVHDEVIVEIKAMDKLSSNEHAQIINYLKATKLKIGLLINFGSQSLEYKRFVYGTQITKI